MLDSHLIWGQLQHRLVGVILGFQYQHFMVFPLSGPRGLQGPPPHTRHELLGMEVLLPLLGASRCQGLWVLSWGNKAGMHNLFLPRPKFHDWVCNSRRRIDE